MNFEIVEQIKQFARTHPNPSPSDFIKLDWPKLQMTKQLLLKLGYPTFIENVDEPAGRATLSSASGHTLLDVHISPSKNVVVSGEMASQLTALLMAIRVLEVESFDWVLLPPHLREVEIKKVAQKAGVNLEQYRRLTALWNT